jgi:hypothetical protein
VYPAHRQLGLPAPQQPEEFRIARGSVYSVVQDQIDPAEFAAADPRVRFVLPRKSTLRGLGFRCARSMQPRLTADDFSRELSD